MQYREGHLDAHKPDAPFLLFSLLARHVQYENGYEFREKAVTLIRRVTGKFSDDFLNV
jgi:hypothetical protein